ncbi:MAG: alpha-L-rhamnosidase N-terminal domain-containing protein, partial [Bacteroidia bacterium]
MTSILVTDNKFKPQHGVTESNARLVIAYGAPKMILKLEVQYSDGSSETIVSDETWKTAASPLTFSSIYGGEDYDAQLEQKGWDVTGFTDSGWKDALAVKGPGGIMEAQKDPCLKV